MEEQNDPDDEDELVNMKSLREAVNKALEQQAQLSQHTEASRQVQQTQDELNKVERDLQNAEFIAKFDSEHPSDVGKGQEILDAFDKRLSRINPDLSDAQREAAARAAIEDAYREVGVSMEPEKPKKTSDDTPPNSTEGTKFNKNSASSPDGNKPRAFDPVKMQLWADED